MTQRLRLVFEELEGFREEYERNMSAGGAFVHTEHALELREQVEVELSLVFSGQTFVLEAEVVHQLPGAVAVQFMEDASELRARLSEHLAGSSDQQEEPSLFETAEPSEDLVAPEVSPSRQAEPEPQHELEVEAEYTHPEFDSLNETDDLEIDPGELEQVLKDTDGELRDEDLVVPEEDERRKGPRSRASVPARLATSDFHVDGLTRDLSESGVLISADASEIPLGKQVKLRLQSPNSGDHIEVTGRVSRHVEADGTVAAVGVKFESSESEADLIADFVEDVRANAAERQEAGISGQIEELGMPNLVQMLGNTSPKGTLIATHGEEEGVVAFEGGLLRYARLGALRGTKALSRLLAWEDGRFEFFSNVDTLDEEDGPQSLEAAILDAVRQMDERARVDGVTVELTTTFAVDWSAGSPESNGSKIEQAVLDLAEAGFTLRRLIDVIPEPDAEILGAVNALVDLGVLIPQN
ncbi:MAG: PilZ domain-containing protein [Deltaproteobacteria bacterium]|nr:PilZ domain-containing protein [Deltaproteobacteria bacterium]